MLSRCPQDACITMLPVPILTLIEQQADLIWIAAGIALAVLLLGGPTSAHDAHQSRKLQSSTAGTEGSQTECHPSVQQAEQRGAGCEVLAAPNTTLAADLITKFFVVGCALASPGDDSQQTCMTCLQGTWWAKEAGFEGCLSILNLVSSALWLVCALMSYSDLLFTTSHHNGLRAGPCCTSHIWTCLHFLDSDSEGR